MTDNLSYLQFSPESQHLDRKSARKKSSELLKHLIAFVMQMVASWSSVLRTRSRITSLLASKMAELIPLMSSKRLTVRCVTLPWIDLLKKSLCETIRVKTV